jgi:hypothetical protein
LNDWQTIVRTPIIVTLRNNLKQLTPSCEAGGVDLASGVCILMSDNATGIPSNNLTGGRDGLPPMTVAMDSDNKLKFVIGCQLIGTAAFSTAIGAYVGSICGSAIA